jgi:hypothetical protein
MPARRDPRRAGIGWLHVDRESPDVAERAQGPAVTAYIVSSIATRGPRMRATFRWPALESFTDHSVGCIAPGDAPAGGSA